MKQINKNFKESVDNIKNIEITEKGFCQYCNYTFAVKRIIKCSRCDLKICKSCATYINDVPFCPHCVIDFVRNDSLLIISKGNRN